MLKIKIEKQIHRKIVEHEMARSSGYQLHDALAVHFYAGFLRSCFSSTKWTSFLTQSDRGFRQTFSPLVKSALRQEKNNDSNKI